MCHATGDSLHALSIPQTTDVGARRAAVCKASFPSRLCIAHLGRAKARQPLSHRCSLPLALGTDLCLKALGLLHVPSPTIK